MISSCSVHVLALLFPKPLEVLGCKIHDDDIADRYQQREQRNTVITLLELIQMIHKNISRYYKSDCRENEAEP